MSPLNTDCQLIKKTEWDILNISTNLPATNGKIVFTLATPVMTNN